MRHATVQIATGVLLGLVAVAMVFLVLLHRQTPRVIADRDLLEAEKAWEWRIESPFVVEGDVPAGMSVSAQGLAWTPEVSQEGAHVLHLQVGSWPLHKRYETSLLVVANQPPQLEIPSMIPPAHELVTWTLDLVLRDDTEVSPSVRLVQAPEGMTGTLGPDRIHLRWQPAKTQQGTHVVEVTVEDGQHRVTSTFEVMVSGTNTPPRFQNPSPLRAYSGETFQYRLVALDDEKDPLRWELLDGPPTVSLDPDTGLLRWRVTGTQHSTPIRIKVSDPSGASDEATVVLQLRYLRQGFHTFTTPQSGYWLDEDHLLTTIQGALMTLDPKHPLKPVSTLGNRHSFGLPLLSGHWAYAAVSRGIATVDTRDPRKLTIARVVNPAGNTTSTSPAKPLILGDRLFRRMARIYVCSLEDPSSPRVRDPLPLDRTTGMSLGENSLYAWFREDIHHFGPTPDGGFGLLGTFTPRAGGNVTSVYSEANMLYVAMDSRLIKYDMSGAEPAEVASSWVPLHIKQIHRVGDYLYLSNQTFQAVMRSLDDLQPPSTEIEKLWKQHASQAIFTDRGIWFLNADEQLQKLNTPAELHLLQAHVPAAGRLSVTGDFLKVIDGHLVVRGPGDYASIVDPATLRPRAALAEPLKDAISQDGLVYARGKLCRLKDDGEIQELAWIEEGRQPTMRRLGRPAAFGLPGRLFIATEKAVILYDVEDASRPERISEYPVKALPAHLTTSGDLVALRFPDNHMEIWRVQKDGNRETLYESTVATGYLVQPRPGKNAFYCLVSSQQLLVYVVDGDNVNVLDINLDRMPSTITIFGKYVLLSQWDAEFRGKSLVVMSLEDGEFVQIDEIALIDNLFFLTVFQGRVYGAYEGGGIQTYDFILPEAQP